MIKTKDVRPKFLDRIETSFLGKVSNVAVAYVFLFVWTTLISFFYRWLLAEDPIFPFQIDGVYQHPVLVMFFFSCIIAPFIEEILFRVWPIQVIKATGKKELLLPTILFSSIIFGLLHNGSQSILLQGVFGVVVSILYIKNNYSYWSIVALHAIWNFTIMLNIAHV